MKPYYLLLLIILAFCLSNSVAQTVTVEIDKDNKKYEVKLDNVSQFIHVPNGDGYDLQYEKEGGKFESVTALANNSNKYNINSLYGKSELDGKSINYKLIKVDSSDTVLFTIKFTIPQSDNSTKIPIPYFLSRTSDISKERSRRNRHLIIDANPNHKFRSNTELLKYKTRKSALGKAHAIPKNGSIAVFIKNYNFWNIEEISISMNEEDYTYNKGLVDVRNMLLEDDKDSAEIEEEKGEVQTVRGEDTKNDTSTQDLFLEYLKNVYENWAGIDYLNFNDLQQVEYFKESLTDSIKKTKKY